MDTATAPQPPVAAPAAVPAPTPAPPAADLPVSSVTGKPVSAAAHSLFKMLAESGDPMKEKPAAEPEKPAATPAPTPVPAPVEPEAKVRVPKKTPKRPELPIAPAPVTPPAPTPAAPEANWEDSLLDDEKAALEDAKFAEGVNPKHKGLADKMGKFFREQKKFLEAHPNAEDDDPEYKRVLALMPTLTAADKREIAEGRIEDRVAKKHEGRFADLQHELYVRDEEPKVAAEAMQIRRHLAFNALPKEMLDVLKEKGLPALQKEYADELEVAGGLINTVVADTEELLRITRLNPKTSRALGVVAADPSHPKWDQHNRIATMVNTVCDDFQKNAPQSEQLRDGKWFVTRDEWAKIPAAQRAQFWTFGNGEAHVREMIQRVLEWQPGFIAAELKKREDSLKARGYVRQRIAAVAPVPAPTPPVPSSSPATPRPAPAPAPAATPNAAPTAGKTIAGWLAAGQ